MLEILSVSSFSFKGENGTVEQRFVERQGHIRRERERFNQSWMSCVTYPYKSSLECDSELSKLRADVLEEKDNRKKVDDDAK